MKKEQKQFSQHIAGKYNLSSKNFSFNITPENSFIENDKYILLSIGNIFDKDTFKPLDLKQVLDIYEKKTCQFLDDIDGLFSIVVYNKQTNDLYIFQDYMSSVLPLYYTVMEDTFYFSTSLKQILLNSGIQRQLNWESLPCLMKNFCIMDSKTLVSGVYKLEPKHYIRVQDFSVNIHRWKCNYSDVHEPDIELLKNIIDNYIKMQLSVSTESVVNVALSGGYDSNLILNRVMQQSLKTNTYTIGSSYGKTELPQVVNITNCADNVALFSHSITSTDYEHIPDIVFRLEGAVHENGVPLQYFLGQTAAKQKAGHLLCGESADETMCSKYNDDELRYSVQDLSSKRISFVDNPFYSTNLVVLKKSGILLNSFGICPHYPYKTKQFISFANALKDRNNNQKVLYKEMCKQILPSCIIDSISSSGGATDPRALCPKENIEHYVEYLRNKGYLSLFEWSDMHKQDILSAYDSANGFEIVSDILSGLMLMIFERVFLSKDYDECFCYNDFAISMSELLKMK